MEDVEGCRQGEEVEKEKSDGEILDELTTSRGELKVKTLSFRREGPSSSSSRELFKTRSVSFNDKHLQVSYTAYSKVMCIRESHS